MDDTAGEDHRVANFIGVTGADTETAQQVLAATDYNLEDAINLFFASGMTSSATTAQPAMNANVGGGGGDPASSPRAQEQWDYVHSASGEGGDVRAPLPIQRSQSLYEDDLRAPQLPHFAGMGMNPSNAVTDPENAVAAVRDMAMNTHMPFNDTMHGTLFGHLQGQARDSQRESNNMLENVRDFTMEDGRNFVDENAGYNNERTAEQAEGLSTANRNSDNVRMTDLFRNVNATFEIVNLYLMVFMNS